jgi:hypothetical protein
MTIQPPKILVKQTNEEYSFLFQIAQSEGISVEALVSGIVTEAIKAKKRELSQKSKTSTHKTVDEVLGEVRTSGEDKTTQ